MRGAELYDDLAELFSYPWRREPLHAAVERLSALGVESLERLAHFVAASPLGALQEEFVAAFDLNPRCAPYAGHHLYGEDRMRGDFLIRLQELYRGHGYPAPQGEPADHLPAMFRFAAHLAREGGEGECREFVAGYLADGVRRLLEGAEKQDGFVWLGGVAAACAVCAAQCEEVHR